MNLPSSSPSEGWILLDAIMEALLDASRASWTSLSSALASSDFAADDFADDDELELLATEEAKHFFIINANRKNFIPEAVSDDELDDDDDFSNSSSSASSFLFLRIRSLKISGFNTSFLHICTF